MPFISLPRSFPQLGSGVRREEDQSGEERCWVQEGFSDDRDGFASFAPSFPPEVLALLNLNGESGWRRGRLMKMMLTWKSNDKDVIIVILLTGFNKVDNYN